MSHATCTKDKMHFLRYNDSGTLFYGNSYAFLVYLLPGFETLLNIGTQLCFNVESRLKIGYNVYEKVVSILTSTR